MKTNHAKPSVAKGMPPKGMPPMKIDGSTFIRVVKLLFKNYPVLYPMTLACIAISAIVSAIPAVFLQQVTSLIDGALTAIKEGTLAVDLAWATVGGEIVYKISLLIVFYVLSLITITVDSQLMVFICQGFLSKMRIQMFGGMQNLPIKFFDTNKHGDIMSYYTNDIDTLRQLVSQSIPTLIRSSIIVVTVLVIMLSYSLLLTGLLLCGVFTMF